MKTLSLMVALGCVLLNGCDRDGIKCTKEVTTWEIPPQPYKAHGMDRFMYFGEKGMTAVESIEDVPDHLLHAVWLETQEPRPPQIARIVDFTQTNKSVTLMTRQRGMLLQFSASAGLWAAELAKTNAMLLAEDLPESSALEGQADRDEMVKRALGEIQTQDDRKISVGELERKRRIRTALWAKPTADDYVRHPPVPLWYQTMECQAPDQKGVWHRDIAKPDEREEYDFLRKFAKAPATVPVAFDDSK